MKIKKISKILLPTDFSAGSEEAGSYAVELCHALGAKLKVLHVIETGHFAMYGERTFWPPQAAIQEIERAAQRELDRFVKKLGVEISSEARIQISARSSAEEIEHCARDEGIDLIVMSTHGRRGLDRVLLGSVADRIVKTAPCPVLVVRPVSSAEK
jgi:nucleotide-binding universal stress UspA family protein